MSLSWIPNAISTLRILLVAPVLMLIDAGEYGWALALFTFAGFSDGLDGYLAVRFKWQSKLGARTSCWSQACSSCWRSSA